MPAAKKNTQEKNNAASLEASLDQLNKLVEKMEKEELSLEDSFALYQQGMKLLKQCSDSIDKVEKKLIVLEQESAEG